MKGLRFGEALQVLPLLVPAAATDDTAKVSSFVDMSLNHWYTFIAQFGATFSVTDTGLVTIKVQGSTNGADSDGNTVDIPFSYRITSAIGAAPSAGTITAGSTSGSSVASTDLASALLMVSFDPASAADYRYVRLSIDPAADTTAWTVGIIGVGEPRYPGNSLPTQFTAT